MLIPPELRARLRGLRIGSHVLANGRGIGRHLGRSRGAGLEFEQYRAYEPGDEPRRVDWKLYARSDRFFVRDATRDSPLTIWVLLDATASMAQADAARPAYSKLTAAKMLAACVAEIATMQGDSFGLASIDGRGVRCMDAGIGARHRDRLLLQLEPIECAGGWPRDELLRPLWERVAADSLVVMISDGFDPALPVLAARLAAARCEVWSLGLISAEERDFPFVGGVEFRDPETGAVCRVDTQAARAEFLERFAQSRTQLARSLADGGIAHIDHALDEPLDRALRRLQQCATPMPGAL
jgi:uncharacterized protein (DUF58 family)